VIATVGKSPVSPQIPGVERDNVHQAGDVLEGTAKTGDRAVILGAGNIGFEVAEFLSRRRVQISFVDNASEAGHGMERDARKILTDRFRDRGIRIWMGSEVLRITDDGLHFRDSEGKERSVEADTVVLALDSVPDNTKIEALQSGDFELLTVGFCERPEGVYSSTREGASIARQI
jgi:pyruvate/2-oxoglutarate dehydrogenase complex dihydrolipoamide dehydrogenase (E3) component